MNRIHLAAIVFTLLLLTVFFNYIYVGTVREKMLAQIDDLRAHAATAMQPADAEKEWKSRKRLLAFSIPRTALDQIDMQFTELRSCALSQDHSAYLRACYRLRELVLKLDG